MRAQLLLLASCRAIAERQRPLSGSAILRHPSNLLRPEKWGSLQRHQHDPVHAADAESGLPPPKPLSEAEGEKVALVSVLVETDHLICIQSLESLFVETGHGSKAILLEPVTELGGSKSVCWA